MSDGEMAVAIIGVSVLVGIAWFLVGYPVWNVWASRKAGEAETSEAEARLRATEFRKQAAVIEAEAVSLQIRAIGEQLQKHDLYLKWQWIKMMEDRDSEADTIYVPTEAGLPILEAGRRLSDE